MEEDKSNFMGRTFEADEYFLVTAERIASFCASIGDDNPLYLDAAAAKAALNPKEITDDNYQHKNFNAGSGICDRYVGNNPACGRMPHRA